MDHYERLVARCVEALATFDPSSTSVEDHLERFLVSSEKTGEGEEEEVTFVREVVAGCVRYQQLVKVVVSGFYLSAQGRSCLRADSCLYNGESPPVVSLYIDCSDLTSYTIWCKGTHSVV
jgi:hypothetical protein